MVLNSKVLEFKRKMVQNDMWQFYIIRAITVRSSGNNPWKIIWLVVIPQRLGIARYNILLNNPVIKFVEEVLPFNSIHGFLSELFTNEYIKIGSTTVSTDLVKFEPEARHLDRYESKSITGTEYPGELLFVRGPDPKSDIFSSLKKDADYALLTNNPPFESVEDAVNELYRVNPIALDNNYFGTHREFRALLMVLNPLTLESIGDHLEDFTKEVIIVLGADK